jgi:hypothetical protein
LDISTYDDPDLAATDLALAPVDESDLLAEVEGSSLGSLNTLQLQKAGVGVGVANVAVSELS